MQAAGERKGKVEAVGALKFCCLTMRFLETLKCVAGNVLGTPRLNPPFLGSISARDAPPQEESVFITFKLKS
jgi:hypothetical protein